MNPIAASALTLSLLAGEVQANENPRVTVTPNGSQPSARGPADWFTGTVRVDAPFKGSEAARVSGATVTFEPGARTAWHTHAEQCLHEAAFKQSQSAHRKQE